LLNRPADVDYLDALDDAAQEWLRMRIWIDRGRVVRFTVQYETTLAGQWVRVVRYDTAHGYAHLDVLDQLGRVGIKIVVAVHLSFDQALTVVERDLRQNWQRYRQGF
jgi:hypothetical protein